MAFHSFFQLYFPLLLFVSATYALPLKISLHRRDVQVLSQDFLNSTLLRPALFSRLAYCAEDNVKNLTCGAPCKDLAPEVEILEQGGDGSSVPRFFIAHDRKEKSIVVGHQGTNSQSILSILNDAAISLVPLGKDRFPGFADKNVKVHQGFQEAFENTADVILRAVKEGLASKNATKVLITGHSQGGAIALMDGMLLRQELDPSIEVRTITFATPRGGDQAWADLVDTKLGTNQMFVSNGDDPVPRLPPSVLGFQHSGGEIHINVDEDKEIVQCPGQENEDPKCTIGDRATGGGLLGFLPDVNLDAHKGPYFNSISFGQEFCPRV